MAAPNNSASSNATARPSKQYFCDCSRYCKSRRVQVSRSTYQRHATFRQADVENSLTRTDRLSTAGQSNGIHQQERPMNGEIVQPRVAVDTAASCGSDPPGVSCHPFSRVQEDTMIFVECCASELDKP